MNESKVEREKQIEGRLHSRLHATTSPQPVEGREAPWSSGQIPGAARQCIGREVILTSLTASPAADLIRFSASGEQERARTVILGILEACVPAQSWLQYQLPEQTPGAEDRHLHKAVLSSLKLSPSHQKQWFRKGSPFYNQNKDG